MKYQVSEGKKISTIALLFLILNLYSPNVANRASAGQSISPPNKVSDYYHGLDNTGIRFAQNTDGTRAKYIEMSDTAYRLQIDNGSPMGDFEVHVLSPIRSLVIARISTGDTLLALVQQIRGKNKRGSTDLQMSLKFRDKRASFTSNQFKELLRGGSAENSPLAKDISDFFREVSANSSLVSLIKNAIEFSDEALVRAFALALSPAGRKHSCATQVIQCIAALGLHILDIFAIGVACVNVVTTAGASAIACWAAIAAHPLTAANAAAECIEAKEECEDSDTAGGAGGGDDEGPGGILTITKKP